MYNSARLMELPIPEDPNENDQQLLFESLSFDDGGNSSVPSNFDRSADGPDPLANISNIGNGEISIEDVIIISDDDDDNGAIGEVRATVNSCRATAIIKNEYGPSTSREAARKSNCAVLTEKTITKPTMNKPSSHAKLPPPVSCKLEYDNFSGFVPFVVDVSEKVFHKIHSMFTKFFAFKILIIFFSVGYW